jgi:putative FmdB family regulatory protein
MPIYEYVCTDCAGKFEKLVRRWGDAVNCPTCESAAVDKQLSTFAVTTGGGRAETFSGCARNEGSGCGASACGDGSCGMA